MNPLEQIKMCEEQFTRSEQRIESYVLANPDMVAAYPIVEIAEKMDVSKSALLRFCQKIGYSGYTEFKYEVSKYLLSGKMQDSDAVKNNYDMVSIYVSCIQKIPDYISDSKIDELCRLILQARKIKLYGVHESGLSAQYFAYRLASLGVDAEAVTMPGSFSDKASFSKKDDLNLFISISGMTPAIVEAACLSFDKAAHTALITQNAKAKYASRYDSFISIPSLNADKNALFLDSQAILFISLDLIISRLATML
jgi:DNA-binding MurR/RpiR family transcriptional regulator